MADDKAKPYFPTKVRAWREYGLHDANVATRELALCVWFCVGYKAKADVRRYYKKCTYASKTSNFIGKTIDFIYLYPFYIIVGACFYTK